MIRRNGYLCAFGYVGWPAFEARTDEAKIRPIGGAVKSSMLVLYCEPIYWTSYSR